MAGLLCSFQLGGDDGLTPISLAAGVEKGVWSILAPTNQRLVMAFFDFGFYGISSTSVPVTIVLYRPTDAGSGASDVTAQILTVGDEAPQATIKKGFTTKPAKGASGAGILKVWTLHPQGGQLQPLPMNQEIFVPGGTRLAMSMLAEEAVDVVGTVGYWE